MFIVFEGIDGSGKTTVSNQVAKGLRARGIPVEHVREGGTFNSPLVNRMREFGKDARNMSMTSLAEFFFYIARDVQLASECIRPALDQDALVIADRYLYSYEVLGHYGRGLPIEQVRKVLNAAADGLWPEMVILMDVDPYIARARRRVSKIIKKGSRNSDPDGKVGGSRKGLKGGLGMPHLLRQGYLELARKDPRRWRVIDNADPVGPDTALYAIVNRLTDLITNKWQDRHSASHHVLGAIRTIRRAASKPINVEDLADELQATPRKPATYREARDAFYSTLEARAVREVGVAAYFLSRLDDEMSWRLRLQWAEHAPAVVAWGLRGLNDERAWTLREKLAKKAPHHVARSLSGRSLDAERAQEMRERFLAKQPFAVLGSIAGDDSADAWSIRERVAHMHLERVVPSLAQLDSERAWALRTRYIKDMARTQHSEATAAARLIKSLTGLDDSRSWELRERYVELIPSAVLSSLDKLESDSAWELREKYVDQAPKIVLRTFNGSTDWRAWEMRTQYASRIKEALDSMDGLDHERAWKIRADSLDTWPSTMVKSLGALGLEDRGRALALCALTRHPDNISLLKHLTRLATMEEQSIIDEQG